MKKLLCLLLSALLLSAFAVAEAPLPEDTNTRLSQPPVSDDGAQANSITLELEGQRIELPFDDSPEYSSIADGVVQASFYAYTSGGEKLYELYILFPESARAGDEITPRGAAQDGMEGSVVLIVSDVDSQREDYYFSSVTSGVTYPEESDFLICVDSIEASGSAVTYAGRLTASLVALDMSTGEVVARLDIPETAFSFTIGQTEPDRHASPMPSPLPDDMRKV
ncbi:MAG: hypothetical protein IJ124_05805 [Clostridia bacterium]|nr:hypothetical protein [Clostridia bacterium]